MKFNLQILRLIFNKCVKKYSNGRLIKDFCEDMGVVYIKLAQMMSVQDIGKIFTVEDKQYLSNICSNCKTLPFKEIKKIIEEEYDCCVENLFDYINEEPIGAASISQVYKAKLKNGDIIALKVKRKDITSNVSKQLNQIKKMIHIYGRFFKFENIVGFDRAIDLYLNWIYQETDFTNEIENIKKYTDFVNSVNGKVEGNKEIVLPRFYPELCTENIIVMEYIEDRTIDKLEITEENKLKINNALNSYISSSMYAMFNDLKIVFHGDPHSGNIYIDKDGNIGFLDMGLLFELSDEDVELTKNFFFAVYSRDYDKIYDLVIPYGSMNENKKTKFKEDIKVYCDELNNKPVTSYFIDLMNICLKYEVCPPNFMFCIAKSFICLDGINKLSNNQISGKDLLKEQVVEFYVKKTLYQTYDIVINNLNILPHILDNTFKYGLIKGVVKGIVQSEENCEKTREMLYDYKKILYIFDQDEQFETIVNKVLKRKK